MPTVNHAITSIITGNYVPQALTLYSYIKESNPGARYLVMIIGEPDCMPKELPEGPEWIYWDAIYTKEERLRLASEYLPFELACVTRGRFHQYLATKRDFDKWIMLDSDIGILSELDPVWQALDSSCIVLTPHATRPVNIEHVIPHEKNILRSGLFNGGVVAMKRSATAEQASYWLSERLEAHGHAYTHRKGTGLPNFHEFEFVDQIWLNLLYMYFQSDTAILSDETCNLGHWNLHQGELELRENKAYFNGRKVVIAHFSGLPLGLTPAEARCTTASTPSSWEAVRVWRSPSHHWGWDGMAITGTEDGVRRRTRTSWPASRAAVSTWEPMKPVPPVRNSRIRPGRSSGSRQSPLPASAPSGPGRCLRRGH